MLLETILITKTKQNKTESNQALTNLQKIIPTVENSIEEKKKKTQLYLKKKNSKKTGRWGQPIDWKIFKRHIHQMKYTHCLAHDSNKPTIFKTKQNTNKTRGNFDFRILGEVL